jgi:hypothetical protein
MKIDVQAWKGCHRKVVLVTLISHGGPLQKIAEQLTPTNASRDCNQEDASLAYQEMWNSISFHEVDEITSGQWCHSGMTDNQKFAHQSFEF